MTTMYKVTGHAAHATVNAPTGRVRQLFFKGQLLPPDAPQIEIDHLLSVKLISPIEVGEPSVTVAGQQETQPQLQEPSVTDAGGDGSGGDEQDGTDSSTPPPDNAEADADAKWAEAVGKAQVLAAAGNKPDGRSGPLVLAAYLVEKGYDRAAVEKADKKDLLDLVNGLSG
ncbi:MAG TPA: hypothetical protein VGW74_14525 [Propionibacteriaceae bacterium]|nr:hypothetical protein [Propionibacteriaceae bacterium]